MGSGHHTNKHESNVVKRGRLSFQRPNLIYPSMSSKLKPAHQAIINGRGTMSSKSKRPVTQDEESIVYPLSEEEYRKGIDALKNNKAGGRDDVLVELKGSERHSLQAVELVPKTTVYKWWNC